MNNLFIMHTQYNLILSAGILSRYKDSKNTLVLFSEFALSDEMLDSLSATFDKVIVARDSFFSPKSALEEIKEIRKSLQRVRSIKKEKFDNIFMSQERVFDLILCARFKKNNPNARCYAVEEDVYYSVNEKYNAEDFVYHESRRMKWRKFLYALLLLGHPYNYRDVHYFYGMSSEYHGVNVLFPTLVRREIRNKEIIEITKNELLDGIDRIYSQKKVDYPASNKYSLFFFDLMNRYKNADEVKRIALEVLKASLAQGRTPLFKYHPRETDKFTDIEGIFEIPHIIPAEKVLSDLIGTDVVVIGNATTACVVSAKLGFKVISICKLEAPTNTMMHNKISDMGINCISTTTAEVKTLLNKWEAQK